MLNVVCSIAGKKKDRTLTITFRNDIEGIIQRIGDVELALTSDTDDVDLFGWTTQVIEQRDQLEEEARSYKERRSKRPSPMTGRKILTLLLLMAL